MKRAPWYVVAGAVAGFAGVVGLHNGPASLSTLAQAKAGHPGAGTAGPGASGTSAGGGGASGGSAAPGGSASSGSGAPQGAGPAASGPARSATGAMEQYGYGELEVKVTVSGSRITGLTVPVLRTAEPYSQQIADQVIPMLKSEVLSAQGTSVNGISGATYTCEAYVTSLQSALDKLHVK